VNEEILAAARKLVEAQPLRSRADYEKLWYGWEQAGFRVRSCESSDQQVQVLGDVAVFTHSVLETGDEIGPVIGEQVFRTRSRQSMHLLVDQHAQRARPALPNGSAQSANTPHTSAAAQANSRSASPIRPRIAVRHTSPPG